MRVGRGDNCDPKFANDEFGERTSSDAPEREAPD
jgi:hypothetical protein